MLLVLAMAAQFAWTFTQFDVKKAYLLATPQREYYVRYPPGFGTYLRMKHGHLPFDPDKFLLRVVKNCYGARDAGVLWYNLLASFLMHTHEQAPSTKGPEPHNRPLSTSAPGTSHSKWSRSFRCLRMILDQPRLQQTPVGERFSLTPFSKAQPPPLREGS